MPSFSANSVLRVWEEGLEQPPLEQALTILRHWVGSGAADPAALTLPERDVRLFEAREALFGRRLPGYATCPHCAQPLEFDLAIDELRQAAPTVVETDVALEELSLRVRLPTSRDLDSCAKETDSAEQLQAELVARCIVSSSSASGAPLSSDALRELASLARAQVCEAWEVLAPAMNTELNLRCLQCERSFSQDFDIAAFFWTEIAVLARRLLREVAELARVYNWRETDILAMSARRRQAYLELIGS